MSNIVLQLSLEEQNNVKATYRTYQIERKAPGVVFAAKLPDVAITVYRSGKVMFQGAGANREANKFGKVSTPDGTSQNTTMNRTIQTKGDTLPDQFAMRSVIGSDETGTGDYFGPITVAAVYVPSSKIELIQELGVKDSKMLTDAKMIEIAPAIKAACTHSILTLRNDKYNELQGKGYSQGKIKALLHNQALRHVLNKMAPEKPEYILIDQFAERNTYYKHIQTQKDIVRENVLFSTKAEQLHVAVAAASILARYAFLNEMDKLSKLAGMELQKGASGIVDKMAAQIWIKHNEEFLRSISKWHFANTEKARVIVNKIRNR